MKKVVGFAAILLAFGFLFTASPNAAKASPSWEGEWIQDSHSDFRGGSLENVQVTGPGNVHLPVEGYIGNEFVIDDDKADDTKLTSTDDRVSLRFEAQNSKKLVQAEVRIYQTGDAMTWNLRIESDNNGEPSGNLVWTGAEGSAFVDGSGRTTINLNSPGTLSKGNTYHIVISPEGTPDGSNYINPHTLSPLNEYWIGRTTANENRDTLVSSDGGSSWTELGREPVYVLNFADGTGEGNPYYSDTDQEVYGGYFPGDGGNSVGQVLSPGEAMGGTVENLSSMGFYVVRNGNPEDNLYLWLYDLTGSKYLIENQLLAENSISDSSFTWQDASFSPIDLKGNRKYLAYLTSPGSDSENNFEVKSLHSYTGDPWPSVTYGAVSSVYVESQVSGDVTMDSDVYGVGGAIFENSEGYDLSFRFALDYTVENGIYTSPVIDAAEEWNADSIVGWDNIIWNSITPENTSIEIKTCSGNKSSPNSSWSSWESVSNASDVPSPNSRYLQYRAKLHTDNENRTPVLQDVTIKASDVLEPTASGLNPFDGQVIAENLPKISASLSEDLSGIVADKVRLWINGTEVLPTYDEVTQEVRYQTFNSLEEGVVDVKLKATDEGGNTLTKRWSFSVHPSAIVTLHSSSGDFAAGEVDGVDYRASPGDLRLENAENHYQSEGSFVSPVIDAGGKVEWERTWWNSTLPDNTSLVVKARLSDDGSTWTNWRICTNQEPIPGSVSRYLQYKVELATSNENVTPALHEIGFAGTDAEPPEIDDLSPARKGITNSSTPTISAVLSDELTGIDNSSFIIKLDNQELGYPFYDSSTGKISYTSTLEEGSHIAEIKASDEEGNTSSKSWQFTVDTTAPTPTITSPASGHKTRSKKITVKGTVDDSSATVTVNGVEATVSGTNFEATVKLTGGQNTVVATATDPAGNVDQDSISVTYKAPSLMPSIWSIIIGLVIGIGIVLVIAFGGGVIRK